MERTGVLATAWAEAAGSNVLPLSEADNEVLAEIRAVLSKHGALDRFGVCLAHRKFELQPGELVLETTDMETRKQLLEVRSAAEVIGDGNVIETQWYFSSTHAGMACKFYCNYRDYAHTQGHATV